MRWRLASLLGPEKMTRLLTTLLVSLMLTACSVTQPEREVTTVRIPVPVPCISEPPSRPVYATGKGEYPGQREAALAVAADYEKAEQYGRSWEAAASGCYR